MKQSDLNRAVARATGESVRLVQAMGFSPLVLSPPRRPQRPQAHRLRAMTSVRRTVDVRRARYCA
jgi:hypothetical protein